METRKIFGGIYNDQYVIFVALYSEVGISIKVKGIRAFTFLLYKLFIAIQCISYLSFSLSFCHLPYFCV